MSGFNNVWIVLSPDEADYLKQLLQDELNFLESIFADDADLARVQAIVDILNIGDTRNA